MINVFSLFFRKIPALILLNLRKNEKTFLSNVSKEIDCTFCYATKIMDDFKSLEIVTFKKEGRTKLITLTEKGKRLASHVEEMQKLIK